MRVRSVNAAKKLRQMLEQGQANEQVGLLLELVADLQLGECFDLRALQKLDEAHFELAMDLIRSWRFDYHIAARSKLLEDILARDKQLSLRLSGLGMPHSARLSA